MISDKASRYPKDVPFVRVFKFWWGIYGYDPQIKGIPSLTQGAAQPFGDYNYSESPDPPLELAL